MRHYVRGQSGGWMHTRLVSPQAAQGLTCSSQLPPSLPQYHHFLPLLSCRHLVRYIPDYLKSHSHCVVSPLLTAQGQMQGNGASGGCQRQSYSWKALSHSCSHERGWQRIWIRLYRRGMLLSLLSRLFRIHSYINSS